MVSLTTYLREVNQELHKVSWPTREQTWRMTALVLIASGVVGFYVGALDVVFEGIMEWIITH